jgi:molybdopterin/thiamine biosynthesis adenylyltransferase
MRASPCMRRCACRGAPGRLGTRSHARAGAVAQSAEEELLGGSPDVVLDCIDNIDTKVALLAACVRRGVRVLSCAGAGAKADPTRLHVTDVADCVRDPLARAVRHRLRRAHGITGGVPVLFSTEPPRCGLVAPDTAGGTLTTADMQLLPGFRVRTIPVLGTTPALFGCAAAAWTVCTLAGQPFHSAPPVALAAEQVAQQYERLCERERLRFGSEEGVQCDPADVAYAMAELWACRSARHSYGAAADEPPPPNTARKATFHRTRDLVLTRWDAEKPATVDNLVLLTFDEADAHDAAPDVAAVRAAEPDWARRVDAAMARAARDHGVSLA